MLNRDRIRAHLERERDRLTRRLARHETDLSAHRRRVAERDPCAILSPAAAAEDSDQEVRSRLTAAAVSELAAVEDALRRLKESPERFGVCDRCGHTISTARLEMLPHARICEACAARTDPE